MVPTKNVTKEGAEKRRVTSSAKTRRTPLSTPAPAEQTGIVIQQTDLAAPSRQPEQLPARVHEMPPTTEAAEGNPVSLTQLIDDYLAGPGLLRQAVAGMNSQQFLARPIPGKWSTLEVLSHLADFEIVFADRIKRVIAQNEPTLFGSSPDMFAARLAYHERDPGEELQLIELIRKQVARILRTLSRDDLHRRGIHSESGARTLETLCRQITGHIPHHVLFIEEKRASL
jgi:hypothetical protein